MLWWSSYLYNFSVPERFPPCSYLLFLYPDSLFETENSPPLKFILLFLLNFLLLYRSNIWLLQFCSFSHKYLVLKCKLNTESTRFLVLFHLTFSLRKATWKKGNQLFFGEHQNLCVHLIQVLRRDHTKSSHCSRTVFGRDGNVFLLLINSWSVLGSLQFFFTTCS